ncbi:MAG: HAD-IIA family hydrolase [Planctomycetota bacterium]|nr:HAD-IIA family hydrolase [Planctomycetota bacterium]
MNKYIKGDRTVVANAKGFLLDLDGTVYLGDSLIPGSDKFISALADDGRKWLFITNNCSKNPREYSEKLTRLGIDTPVERIFTSGELAARVLRSKGVSRAFVLGTPSLVEQLEQFGIVHDAQDPQVVLSSFDLTLTYDRLLEAVRFAQKGLPLFATHPDMVCPTPDGPIPDSGLITGMIEHCCDGKATYLGKPMTEMVQGASERLALEPSSLLFIGDRLYTDMRMANDAGISSVLVLSGEATLEDLEDSPYKPSLVADSVASLIPFL